MRTPTNKLGQLLEATRRERGLTQNDAAAELRVSRQTYRSWAFAGARPHRSAWEDIATWAVQPVERIESVVRSVPFPDEMSPDSTGEELRQAGDLVRAKDAFSDEIAVLSTGTDFPTLVQTMLLRARVLKDLGEVQDGIAQAREALAKSQEAGKNGRTQAAWCHLELVRIGGAHLEPLAIDTHLREAESACLEINSKKGLALTMLEFGRVYQRRGELEAAHDALTKAARLLQRVGDTHNRAITFTDIGRLLRELGRYSPARAAFRRSAEMADDTMTKGNALQGLGETERISGRPSKAVEPLNQALRLHRRTGNRLNMAGTLYDLGRTERDLKRFDDGRRHHRQAMRHFAALGDLRGQANVLDGLAGISHDEGHLEQWMRLTGEALSLHMLVKNRLGIGASLTTLGEGAARLGQYGTSKAFLCEAIVLLDETGHILNAAIARSHLAVTLAHQGDAAQTTAIARELVAQLLTVIDAAGRGPERAAALKYRAPLLKRAASAAKLVGDTATAEELRTLSGDGADAPRN